MHKDPNLRKRNALVIPGGLLALYGFLGVVYVAALRGDSGSCGDASLIVFLGACRSALLVLAIPIIIGLALVAVGVLRFRSQATCRAGHGSWTHFGLAFLISITLVPLLAMLLSPSLVGEDAVITRGTVDYPLSTVLAGLTGIGLLMLVPFVVLYAAQARANPCCQEKGCFDPCFCDETLTEAPPTGALPDEAPAPAPAAVPEPPAPEPGPTPPAFEPVADAAPSDQWEVIPDEPAGEPEPSRKAEASSTPPLATRPTDPAAPPADAMAVAAKWAEEDEQAMEELQIEQPSRAGDRRSRMARASKKPASKTAKATKSAKKSKK